MHDDYLGINLLGQLKGESVGGMGLFRLVQRHQDAVQLRSHALDPTANLT